MQYEVVVPAWNCSEHLPQTLVSVQRQALAPVRVTLIDDGSTDETATVAGRLAQRSCACRTGVSSMPAMLGWKECGRHSLSSSTPTTCCFCQGGQPDSQRRSATTSAGTAWSGR